MGEMSVRVRPEVLKGHLEMLVLAAVASGDGHGYVILRRLHELSGRGLAVPEGTIYPVLYRLERTGLLSSDWTRVSGRRRRVYTLTAAGRRALDTGAVQWKSFSGAVNKVLAEVQLA